MSTISRTLGNLRKVGLKEYWHQLQYIGDTKAGTLIGTDKFGNKFYENMADELPLRTRWVDYKVHDFDPAQIEPLWHAWISYAVDTPPTLDPIAKTARSWAKPYHIPNYTGTRAAYKPYNTVKPKIDAWEPFAKQR
ncbi:hypothetical protein N0V93_006792 [Gnomoniopsis smithogilvyi]|uniref:NADH dehydrogenase [ubiquinone] 1 alpha subcomplex subunit n=1 Tax=Gnomoniopsis smithogilvyi TaxID=1191159 RepID=A0A9W8YQD9_9PEZI|nr:hypothetical protein N0V93_006792 [Gnomoniopsis smithogilvyi]